MSEFATAFCANGHLADERTPMADTTKSNIQDWLTELTGGSTTAVIRYHES